jgi:hypothetical protein
VGVVDDSQEAEARGGTCPRPAGHSNAMSSYVVWVVGRLYMGGARVAQRHVEQHNGLGMIRAHCPE